MGCGWLGLPLAISFKEAGYNVHGSTTSPGKLNQLSAAGIQPYIIRIKESGIEGPITKFLKGMDLLVINIPPGLRSGSRENYVKKMQAIHTALKDSPVKELVFVSSTSVYGSASGEVTEDTPPAPETESGRQLLEAELIFRQDTQLKTIVVRFGGLIGSDRHPVTMLSGKRGLKNGHAPVNLIHRDDCIHMIKAVVQDGHWNEIFNGVFPAHPKKADYYRREAKKRKISPPIYATTEGESTAKMVISRNYLTKNYSFFTSIYT